MIEKVLVLEKAGEYGMAYRNVGYGHDVNDYLFQHIHTRSPEDNYFYSEWQGRFLTNKLGLLIYAYAGGQDDSDKRYFREYPEFTKFKIEFRDPITFDQIEKKELEIAFKLLGLDLEWEEEWKGYYCYCINITEEGLKQIIEKL